MKIIDLFSYSAFGRKYGGGNKGSGLYPHSGSSSGEGSDEIDKCSVLGFSELLASFRAFPHDPTTGILFVNTVKPVIKVHHWDKEEKTS